MDGISGASRRAWQSCQVLARHTQCRHLVGCCLRKPVGVFPPHALQREHNTRKLCFVDMLIKFVTTVKADGDIRAGLSRGYGSKWDSSRPHYFAVFHINLPFIPFLHWSTSSDHCVIPVCLEFTPSIDDHAVFWLH